MTLFFDTKLQYKETDTISTICEFHPNEDVLAVASFSEEGGSVKIFNCDSVSFLYY